MEIHIVNFGSSLWTQVNAALKDITFVVLNVLLGQPINDVN